MSKITTAKTE